MSASIRTAAETPRLLVTGGHSFLGLHVARAAVNSGYEVTLGHYRPRTSTAEPKAPARSVLLDMRDRSSIRAALTVTRATHVIHLASAGWDESVAAEFRTNALGVVDLLEACSDAAVQRAVLASSIAVYENTPTMPFQESSLIDTLAPSYGPALWKSVQEQLSSYYSRRHGLDVVSARIGIAYGPGYRSMLNLASRVVRAILEHRPVEGALTSPYADFVHASDVAWGLLRLCTASVRQRAYNLGAGSPLSLADFAVIAGQAGLEPAEVERLRTGEPWSPMSYMDIASAQRDLQYSPRSFSAGLLQYVNELRGNELRRPQPHPESED